MDTAARIAELLQQWQRHLDEGTPTSVAELCGDCPELAAELQSRIDAISSQRLHATDTPSQMESHPKPPTVYSIPNSQDSRMVDSESTDISAPDKLRIATPTVPARIGRYRITGKLGEGGMGVVYQGVDPDLDRVLAIKVVKEGRQHDADLCRRFLDEGRIMGRLQHPGIAPIHEIGRLDDGRPFFSMKQIQGKTLAEMLKEEWSRRGAEDAENSSTSTAIIAPLRDTLPRHIAIFEQICQTLAYAHSQGIIHRDLKPHNVMVGEFGEVQVMDWGLAKRMKDEGGSMKWERTKGESDSTFILHPSSLQTRAGDVMGTPAYMPPEQARGDIDQLDERCDVFGLGAILCVILTGRPPFDCSNSGEVFERAQRGNVGDAVTRLRRCGADAELVELCIACLAPNKEDRPRDAGAVAGAVAAYLEGVQIKLRKAQLEQAAAQARAAEERRRRRVTVAFAAVLLLLLAGGGFAVFWYVNEQAQRNNAIGQAVTKAEELRATLHTTLRTIGGVQALLNEPRRWKGEIDQAKRLLRDAKSLHSRSFGFARPPELQKLKQLERKLKSDDDDRKVAMQLEAIRLGKSDLVNGHLDYGIPAKQYEQVLREYGLDVLKRDKTELADSIRASPLREQLIAALQDWAYVDANRHLKSLQQGWGAFFAGKNLQFRRLLRLVDLVDPDPLHKKLRDPAVWMNKEEFARRIAEPPFEDFTAQELFLIGTLLDATGGEARDWFTAALVRFPDDFWLNFQSGIIFTGWSEPQKAVGKFRAALARRPGSNTVRVQLGLALVANRQLDEATKQFETVAANDLGNAMANFGLGRVQQARGNPAAAIVFYRKAIAGNKRYVDAYNYLGTAFSALSKQDEAAAEYRKALKINPNHIVANVNLGFYYAARMNLTKAEEHCHRALKIDDEEEDAYFGLAIAHFNVGNFSQALRHYKTVLKLDPTEPGIQEHIERCERMIALEKRLEAFVQGSASMTASEYLELAELCRQYKSHYVTAVSLYSQAFAKEKSLADDVENGNRYNAACAAVLAAAGKAKDGGQLAEKERPRLRQSALDWLRADLRAWKMLQIEKPYKAVIMQERLGQALRDPDLASVRDAKALATTADTERQVWEQFWLEMESLHKKARQSYTETTLRGTLTDAIREQTHEMRFSKGKVYIIEMRSKNLDSYLRLHDGAGKLIAENDDIVFGKDLDSRLTYTPSKDGTHRLVATSYQQTGRGDYDIVIRFFPLPANPSALR